MAKRTIVAMPGDGIGKVVLEQCIRVLNAADERYAEPLQIESRRKAVDYLYIAVIAASARDVERVYGPR